MNTRDITGYGLAIPASDYRPLRDSICEAELTTSGNIVLRVMRELSDGLGMEQTAYVVLTPQEAMDLQLTINTTLAKSPH